MSLDINNYKKTKGVALGSQWSIGDKKWFKWLGDFIQDIKSYVTTSIDSKVLFKDLSNVNSINTNTRKLYDSTGTEVIDYNNGLIYDNAEVQSISWQSRTLTSSANPSSSIDWDNCTVTDSAGTTIFNYTTQATALTAEDAGVVNSGDATTDAVIENLRTRLGELETRLTTYGLLQAGA